MRVLLWHVHGGWTDAFVRGEHEYLLPTAPGGGAYGLGRAGRDWPGSTREVPITGLADHPFDVVVCQRPEELPLVQALTGRTPGVDVPAVFVEHNTPKQDVPWSRHPLADRPDLLVVHVTHYNDVLWDCGSTPTTVVEHGVVDPGHLYTGELDAAAVVVNEPVRRHRVVGTDLFPRFARAAPLDVFGMGQEGLAEATGLGQDRLRLCGDLPTAKLHAELARRRVYVHTARWTSLGLSLLEAMHLGLPPVVLGSTEAWRAVPPGAGITSTRVAELVAATADLVADPARAADLGAAARAHALARHGLASFLTTWDGVLRHATTGTGGAP
ncbi:glycosyltransferase [Actinokineospora bangkokensis]|uniref:Glycosyl transferase n=1 Tax=Actinokineospora bangkokensis TaxID=1193682 RepID=A0A1Q9LLR7_9PSEU|nr:glycosyltransferase [Actinokineospora bangkokensis]OLR92944.1 glycosyl transferase [Actinokineospora bangkokensis]